MVVSGYIASQIRIDHFHFLGLFILLFIYLKRLLKVFTLIYNGEHKDSLQKNFLLRSLILQTN